MPVDPERSRDTTMQQDSASVTYTDNDHFIYVIQTIKLLVVTIKLLNES